MFPGGYGGGETPVPIPNTEVKPSSADGTSHLLCGRVGRCRDFFYRPNPLKEGLGFLFFGLLDGFEVVFEVRIRRVEFDSFAEFGQSLSGLIGQEKFSSGYPMVFTCQF